MNKVYIVADNIISSLGFSSEENYNNLVCGNCGINIVDDQNLSVEPVPVSLVKNQRLAEEWSVVPAIEDYTRFEQLLIISVKKTLAQTNVNVKDRSTLIVISTTKGNIDLIDPGKSDLFPKERIHLWSAASVINQYFENPNDPVILSNACISGVMALNIAADFIRMGKYENVIVAGADVLSKFIISGFQSFMSLSSAACRPFDKKRSGLTLGEGAGCIILSSSANKNERMNITIEGGGSHNDANHISGPSREGEGAYLSIKSALKEAVLTSGDIDYISAHGTATPYNDEMESVALDRHGLNNIPVNSYKGFWGHTLGAAGIIESVAAILSMRKNILIPSVGYEEHGVSKELNVIKRIAEKNLNYVLKIASGFGGNNGAIIFKKYLNGDND